MEDGYSVIENFNEHIHDNTLHDIPRSYFGVFDGHGGDGCMHFVKKTLHLELARALEETRGDTEASLKLAFAWTEDKWMEKVKSSSKNEADTSGTTATVCILEGEEVFCAYLGDSPAFIMHHKNKTLSSMSEDHKPNGKIESKRIKKNGGTVKRQKKGPHRIYPGGLAVSRSFGDPTAKLAEFGGKVGTLIAEPEVSRHVINDESHFLFLCTDGVTDNVKNKQDIYLPLLRGYEPGIKEASKGSEVDYNLATRRMAVSAVEGLVKNDGYQDNATAVVVMFEATRSLLAKDAKSSVASLDTVHTLNNLF
eukprot:CAMPEP_0204822674 /NCGR_PEP_ID=MMETSP1346-20131115/856_1 /ASSEMBLY_ACC=CAM_ASM_000771 /TAXON_ID=215587 /ORGANISM="Aplanochytrium stocchinoi, Strain GSBS06" /LENGTH=307 /DNA_ID=CAMNT_0051949011 /DNA_START=278 /DNA_END=1201 /DNA_ORIENTATION=-